MAQVGVLQHFWCENSGALGEALANDGHELTTVRLDEGNAVPHHDDFDGWLIMGGPMNVDETGKYPYLVTERELLAKLIAADRPVIGVCLGAQLLARAAGAKVYAQRPKEIGLYDISLTPAAKDDPLFGLLDNPQETFQWHGDTFDLPPTWPAPSVMRIRLSGSVNESMASSSTWTAPWKSSTTSKLNVLRN